MSPVKSRHIAPRPTVLSSPPLSPPASRPLSPLSPPLSPLASPPLSPTTSSSSEVPIFRNLIRPSLVESALLYDSSLPSARRRPVRTTSVRVSAASPDSSGSALAINSIVDVSDPHYKAPPPVVEVRQSPRSRIAYIPYQGFMPTNEQYYTVRDQMRLMLANVDMPLPEEPTVEIMFLLRRYRFINQRDSNVFEYADGRRNHTYLYHHSTTVILQALMKRDNYISVDDRTFCYFLHMLYTKNSSIVKLCYSTILPPHEIVLQLNNPGPMIKYTACHSLWLYDGTEGSKFWGLSPKGPAYLTLHDWRLQLLASLLSCELEPEDEKYRRKHVHEWLLPEHWHINTSDGCGLDALFKRASSKPRHDGDQRMPLYKYRLFPLSAEDMQLLQTLRQEPAVSCNTIPGIQTSMSLVAHSDVTDETPGSIIGKLGGIGRVHRTRPLTAMTPVEIYDMTLGYRTSMLPDQAEYERLRVYYGLHKAARGSHQQLCYNIERCVPPPPTVISSPERSRFAGLEKNGRKSKG